MNPMVLSRHVRDGLTDYIDTTFPMVNRPFRGSMRRLVEGESAFFHEPYMSMKLPFRAAASMEEFPFGECLHPLYKPYVHQMRAFERLAAGKSTLVATGTGSGKTECFLYPILDYCYRHRGEPGIKAVLVYPMNALASDQAKRLAELIYNSPELRGNVTAGMYVGLRNTGDTVKTMDEHDVVNHHDTLLKTPPDILLTNYKMLDYLLVRPEDSQLWRENKPDTLRYFVVDELHTFDGAQGTDLACLLRRLTDHLHTEPNSLCCVGTSATMGSAEESAAVRDYAGQIFHTSFDDQSVIGEDRLDADEFFDVDNTDYRVPDITAIRRLYRLESETDADTFLREAARAWLDFAFDSTNDMRVQLGNRLRGLDMLHRLALALHGRSTAVGKALADELSMSNKEFASLERITSNEDDGVIFDGRVAALDALISLVSAARVRTPSGALRPFLDVQVQLWAKELRQLVATVVGQNDAIRYDNAVNLDAVTGKHYLPVINCRDCGGTGWIGNINKANQVEVHDLSAFYSAYFDGKATNDMVVMDAVGPSYVPANGEQTACAWFCSECMQVGGYCATFNTDEQPCPSCDTPRLPMRLHVLDTARNRRHYLCPFCGSANGLALVGMRATSTISVALSQLSADAFNDDHKAIVFSDSVQDASYRAGFLNARTWRFALRTSIMDYFRQQNLEGCSLADFLDKETAYLRNAQRDDDAYILRFTAPNMTWMSEYENAANHRPAGPLRRRMLDFIAKRIRLETVMELGLRSRIGRTLEKSGCLTIGFSQERVKALSRAIRERAINELGSDAAAIESDDWLRLTAAFLDQLRVDGAFMEQLYDAYLQSGGIGYLLTNSHAKWMPSDRDPAFLAGTKPPSKSGFVTLDAPRYLQLVNRYCGSSLISETMPGELLHILREESVNAGLVNPLECKGRIIPFTVYGLNERACKVTGRVTQLVCDQCGRRYSCATDNLQAWRGARCATVKCAGHLDVSTYDTGLDYYGSLYRRASAPRVRAAEHTGLLDGDDRTRLEQVFKRSQSEQRPGDVNVLTCTPTLEMGIDIGDLSTVILSSMPPGQAQYQQRVGRAGRRDGNAFVLTIANARNHDLYFYQRPDDMINGQVQPPRIFMSAAAVLERQLTAYAMSHWITYELKHDVTPKDIMPGRLGDALDNVRDARLQGFPASFFDYTRNNASLLMARFARLFDFDDDTRAHLEAFIQGGDGQGEEGQSESLNVRVMQRFRRTIDSCKALERQQDDLRAMIADLSVKPDDPTFVERKEECESEIKSIDRTLRSIDRTNIFNYLSDEGVLPNYAFPETGVTLHTILKRRSNDGMDDGDSAGNVKPSQAARRSEPITSDYVRPSSAAIGELAPGNVFYAGGHQYRINRVLLAQGPYDESVEQWRLCPNCSHAEPASETKNVASCPSCGSTQWSDAGQKRPMLRISTVVSEQDYADGGVDDSAEGRSSVFFVRNTFVDIDETSIESAYTLNGADVDFGFEYVPRGVIREINFGEAGNDGPELEVAGDKQARRGFTICTGCGALLSGGRDFKPCHSYACPMKNKAMEDIESSTCLFLYREVTSEALRLLVPGIQDNAAGRGSAESFTAAVMLGLRSKFGNVNHLNVTLSNEPVPGTGLRKTYLVIYDTVPGGTGYLKQLAGSANALADVLRRAYDVIASCDCRSNGQANNDGCYRCLYAYRQSRDLGVISKKTARDMIRPIIAEGTSFDAIATVSKIKVNHLLDSQLEAQFIEALGRLREHPLAEGEKQGRRARVREEIIRNKEGWTIDIADSRWEIEPQVSLGPDDGVAVSCKPDFVLHCVKSDDTAEERKQVAVFTDGLRFHADKVWDDTLKREALRRAGYRVWTLTYEDVFGFVDGTSTDGLADPMLDVNLLPETERYRSKVNKAHADYFDPGRVSTIAMLGEYLARPQGERLFVAQAGALSEACIRKADMRKPPSEDDRSTLERMETALTGEAQDYTSVTRLSIGSGMALAAYVGMRICMEERRIDLTVGLIFDDAQYATHMLPQKDDANPMDGLDDDDRESFHTQWAGFWHWTNIMQYAPVSMFVCTTGLLNAVYQALADAAMAARTNKGTDSDRGWDVIFDDETYSYLSENERHVIEELAQQGVPAPEELGYELEDHGEVAGEATLAWEDAQVALIVGGDDDSDDDYARENRAVFERLGWTVVADATPQSMDTIKQHCKDSKERAA